MRSPHHSTTVERNSGRRIWPQTSAPEAAASCTLRASKRPPWRRACSAVRPATGRVAACASGTPSGNGATEWLGARTRSAQAPDGSMPTIRVPIGGPLPLAALSSTTPAKSQPGRSPGCPCDVARLTSPRFNEIAVTRTVTSSGLAGASSTGFKPSPCGLDGSTTTARTVSGMGPLLKPGWRSTLLKLHSISTTSATGWPIQQTAGGTIDARHERDCRDPKEGGRIDPVLLSDDPDHRGRRGGRNQARYLPPGAGRRPYGRRVLAGFERPAARCLRDAIRAGCGERLRRGRNSLFRLDPGRVSAARPSA